MIRVLLVEDDAMIREMTRIFLESQKRFEVVCAASGEEALAHAKDPFTPNWTNAWPSLQKIILSDRTYIPFTENECAKL